MDQSKLEERKRPKIDDKSVVKLVKNLYGLNVKSIQELNAYDDKNMRVICDEKFENPYFQSIEKNGYVLKITNSFDSRDAALYEGQNEMMLYLNRHSISCPIPVKNLMGSYYSLEDFGEGEASKNIVRLLVYCPGAILSSTTPTNHFFYDAGRFTANLSEKLKRFSNSSIKNRQFIWMLAAVPKLRDYTFAVSNEDDRDLVNQVIEKFDNNIMKHIDKFEMGTIHGDLNEQNLLIDSTRTKVLSVIDFGDVQYSCLIFELIIILCYMIVQVKDIEIGKYVLDGFQSIKKLSELEKKILKTGICGRLSQSLVLGAYSHLNDPNNDYIMTTAKNGWMILRKLWSMSDEEVSNIWGL